jgi:hypothetical protein
MHTTPVIDLSFLDDPIDLPALLCEWDADRARRAMEEADNQVNGLGVSGTDRTITEATEHACRSYYTHDLPGVIVGCTDVCRRARELAGDECDCVERETTARFGEG